MKIKINDIIAQTLVASGVKRAYGMIGYGSDLMMEALQQTDIRMIHVCHEEAGAFAAGADAQFSNSLAVCLGSVGAGSIHYLNGLYDAHRNQSPVLFIATQVKQQNIGRHRAQEVDLKTVFSECSWFCEAVQTAEQLPMMLGMAMQTALIRKGVAVLIVPEDLYLAEIEFDQPRYIPQLPAFTVVPSKDELESLAQSLNAASKVVIFGGKGCEKAHDEVMALAKKIKAAVGWAYRGKEALEHDNPYPIGMNGLLGDKSCLEAVHSCDLLLLLGTGFAFTNFYPDHCEIIQIDIDAANLGLRHWVSSGLVGDIQPTLQALLPLVDTKSSDSFAYDSAKKFADVQAHYKKLALERDADPHHVYPEFLSHAINEKLSADALVVADIGTPWAYMAKYIQSQGTRKLYHSCMHGTMANALSSSIGLQAANPGKQVVAMCGDGGFTMLMGDVLTFVKEKLPVKIFVYNNGRLDFVALEMKTSGIIDYATDLKQADFAQMAEQLGMKGLRVEEPESLSAAIDEAFAYDGPVLVDVLVNPNSLLMPPAITTDMMRKFSEYMWRAFIGGEYKTLKDMLEVNFPRQL